MNVHTMFYEAGEGGVSLYCFMRESLVTKKKSQRVTYNHFLKLSDM